MYLLAPRIPLPAHLDQIEYMDFDQDGDPDALSYKLPGGEAVLWVDDDDDMRIGAWQGDLDNDCLLIDRNQDGIFAGPEDLSVDYGDEDGDGRADLQLVIENGSADIRNQWDWGSNIMWYIDDGEDDGIFAYIDWSELRMKCWERYGHANFYADYHGQNTFTKMSVSSFRLHDFRYSWENPFYFFDLDDDSHSEVSIRMEDSPVFRNKPENVKGRRNDALFVGLDDEIDAIFIGVLDKVYISFDMDNDNGPGNEFDFDMSLQFNGEHGYDYNHMRHRFKSIDGLEAADHLFYDARWRHLEELVYPYRDEAWDILFKYGQWESCWFVFDEDDDCNRWERVELLQPKDPFASGMLQGGIDHNPQADEAGDRGEWDLDNSGGGNLYIAGFDGRIHLHGAEKGIWRIDQDAYSYQGYGGLYEGTGYQRDQKAPVGFVTVQYSDTDGNGFFDLIEYDLDGDTRFELKHSLQELGVDDEHPIISMKDLGPNAMPRLYSRMAEQMWQRGLESIRQAEALGINTAFYQFFLQPESLREKYDYGFWLSLYTYLDLRNLFILQSKEAQVQVNELDRAYITGDWSFFEGDR